MRDRGRVGERRVTGAAHQLAKLADHVLERFGLGIEFLEVGPDFIRGRVPVDTRTRQPYGILHGGVLDQAILNESLRQSSQRHPAGAGNRC